MRSLILVAACVAVSQACSCLPFGTPQEAFCSSDFVSHVKVISKKDPNSSPDGIQDITYTVEHLCVYRKPSTLKQLSNKVVTASNSAACGVELTVGKEYLLGGSADGKGVLRSYLCGIVEEWSTVKDKDALKGYKC
ncbi:tissue inhibitor of metalloproteinase [Oesophagostomum dentatum]|uniref:Tissue inhibitor of metalloproteinase n=1 Tax=Oesophagostomum dentatum TaxID=61180 RepID=A0A0B1SU85_OESDE|nr:tissue inhibitor of metalloproteinase [Oesophagostomum dentatum]